jgi:hypothetical protein
MPIDSLRPVPPHLRPTVQRAFRALLLASVLTTPTTLSGQDGSGSFWERGRFQVGVSGGAVTHSLLGIVNGTLTRSGGGDLTLDVDVKAEPSATMGGFLGWQASPSVGLRVRVAHAGTQMALSALGRPVQGPGSQAFDFGELGDVKLWLAGAELTWMPWAESARARPHVVVGLGASNWEITGLEDLGSLPPLLESPVNLRPVKTTLPSATVGGGIVVALGISLAALIEVSDHISGNPFADDDFRIGSSFAGVGKAKDLVHSLSLTAGLRVDLGR